MRQNTITKIFTAVILCTVVVFGIVAVVAIQLQWNWVFSSDTEAALLLLVFLSTFLLIHSNVIRLICVCFIIVALVIAAVHKNISTASMFIGTTLLFTLIFTTAYSFDNLVVSKILSSEWFISKKKLKLLWKSNQFFKGIAFAINHDKNELQHLYKATRISITTIFTSERQVPNERFFRYCFVFFLLVSLLLYFPLVLSYFIQDEWYYFGLFNQFVDSTFGFVKIFIDQFTNPKVYGIHFTPLWNALFFIEYQVFRLHYSFYIVTSILLHTVTTLLVTRLAFRLTNSRVISFLSGLFFAISFAHSEAVFWVNTHIQTQVATMAAIGAILLWLRALETKKYTWFAIAMSLTLVGLLIKETVFALFPLVFLMTIIYGKRQIFRKSIMWLVIGILIYMPYRIGFAKFATLKDTSLHVGPIIPHGIFDIGPQMYRLLIYPLKALVQEYILPDHVTKMAEIITGWSYPVYAKEKEVRGSNFLTFVQSAGSDMVMILAGALLVALLVFVLTRVRQDKNSMSKKAFAFGVSVVVSSIIPLLFIAGWLSSLFAFVTFIDSRHLYFTSIGGSILFAFTITTLYIFFSKLKLTRRYKIPRFLKMVAIGVPFLIIFYTIYYNYKTVNRVYAVGNERRNIVTTILQKYPSINDRSVFLIESNRAYYGYAELITPFQTNFGYTLLHNYHQSEQYSLNFFKTNFLLDKGIVGEGYMEQDGKGIGYFISEKSLARFIRQSNFPVTNVYAFRYDGNTKSTADMTEEIRGKLKNVIAADEALAQWQRFETQRFRLRYPPSMQVSQDLEFDDRRIVEQVHILSALGGEDVVILTVYNKPDTIGVRGFVADFTDTRKQGVADSKDTNLSLGGYDVWPAVVHETDYEKTYYFNTASNLELKQLTFIKPQTMTQSEEAAFLGSLEFLN